MDSSDLHKKISRLPKKPGVYFFKNRDGKIVYIGKALSLRHRVTSYFNKKLTDPKTKILVSQISNLDFQIVDSEFSALLLEAKLIKEHRPKYNIQLKDNKRYLYIAITKSPYRIFPTRQPELANNLLDWFGPFPSSTAIREVLRTIRHAIPFCSHTSPPRKECLYFHLNLCPGFKNLESVEYQKSINKIRRILKGETKLLFSELTKRMNFAAKNLKFEEAQKYKAQLQALQYTTTGWRSLPEFRQSSAKSLSDLKRLLVQYQKIDPTTLHKIEGYDVSNLGKNIIVGSMVAFVDGQADGCLYRRFKIQEPGEPRENLRGALSEVEWAPLSVEELARARQSLGEGERAHSTSQNDTAGIHNIVSRRLNHPEWIYPQLILVDGGKGQVSATFKALKEKNLAGQICLLGLAKKEETIYIPTIEKGEIVSWKLLKLNPRSPGLQLLQQIRDESHRFAQQYYKRLHRKRLLHQTYSLL